MKKIYFVLILALGLASCKKSTQCAGSCVIVTGSGAVDTIKNDVCTRWDQILAGQGTDNMGNPVNTGNAHLICR